MESPVHLKSILAIDTKRCTGCRNCELACSAVHTGTFNPRRSRVQVLKNEVRNMTLPVVCLQCEKPLCAEACPTVAIAKNSKDILVVDDESCIGCKDCMAACIYGGIVMDPLTGRAIKCDLCQGDPACVKACPYGAIVMLPAKPDGARERYGGIETLLSSYGLVKEEV
jgi:Fe-S-cluster-containing dehydrogenase component